MLGVSKAPAFRASADDAVASRRVGTAFGETTASCIPDLLLGHPETRPGGKPGPGRPESQQRLRMTNQRPTFSVVTPTFNRRDTLPRAVASVLSQTFSDLELVIVDDASSDSYATALARLDPLRIRVIRNTINRGAAGARNVGIHAARGTYVSFLDDDDEYLSSFLESTHAALREMPSQIALSWCGAKIIDYPDDSGG